MGRQRAQAVGNGRGARGDEDWARMLRAWPESDEDELPDVHPLAQCPQTSDDDRSWPSQGDEPESPPSFAAGEDVMGGDDEQPFREDYGSLPQAADEPEEDVRPRIDRTHIHSSNEASDVPADFHSCQGSDREGLDHADAGFQPSPSPDQLVHENDLDLAEANLPEGEHLLLWRSCSRCSDRRSCKSHWSLTDPSQRL